MKIDIQNLEGKSFGGQGGNPFVPRGIRTIAIRSGERIDAIIINGERFGGNGGKLSDTLTLAENEYISKVTVKSGTLVDYIKIETSEKQSIHGGGKGGYKKDTFSGIIAAIGGRHGTFDSVDGLDFVYLPERIKDH
jgi:hypothetical protein